MFKPPVIIIAGGANTRFFPFNTSTHKSGFTLGGQTLLARTLHSLHDHGFNEVIIVISPRDQESQLLAQDVAQTGLPLHVQYVTQTEAKGMGDAVLRAVQILNLPPQSSFAVISAYQTFAGEVLDQMLAQAAASVVTTTGTTHPSDYGIVAFNEQHRVIDIVEKPVAGTEPSNQKLLSLYLLSEQFVHILKELPETEYNFEEALRILLKREDVHVLELDRAPLSLKYPWHLLEFQQSFLRAQASFRHPTAQVAPTAVIDETAGPVYLDEHCVVSHCARVVGPTYIGKHAFIGDFCLVRESNIEEGVKIGVYTEVARSIFMPFSSIHNGYVGDSIVGAHTKIGGGFITANKRFDRQALRVEVKGKYIDTGRVGLGAMIGEHTHIGVNVNVMPGKCIGAHSTIYPNFTIVRNVPPHSVLKKEELSKV